MSRTVDERVVSMEFDNRQFESNVQTSLNTLDKLKRGLRLDGAVQGLENVNDAAKKCNFAPLSTAVESVRMKFSALEVMAATALANITNSAVNAGKRIVKAFTIDPIKTGFQEYETQINAVQTILANTESKGTTLDDVNEALDTLNTYADKTIYNFTEMTRNIGTFTAAGIDLDTSVNAIQGIANLAAVSGSNAQQASTAMYQLSQALASGTVKLMDWNSVVNAGMGGQVFQDALKETARVHGIAIDDMIKEQGSFRETLQKGWLTSEILTETLQKFTLTTEGLTDEQIEANRQMLKSKGYTDEQIESIFKLGETATDAATKVKTFTQLMDTLKEAAQSGWTQTWELLVGDFGEAKELWTGVSDYLGEVIGNSANKRNELLEGALTSKWDLMIKKINEAGVSTSDFEEAVKNQAKEHGLTVDGLIDRYGSLEEAIRNGAIPIRMVTDALDNLKKSSIDVSKVTEGMKKGFEGDDVKQVQNALKELGYDISKFGVDGIFGSETEAALKAFQESKGLEVTGIIDEKTLAALKEAGTSASNLKETVGDLVNGLDELGGRELLIESLKNIFEAITKPIKAIKEAWGETFESMTSEQLYGVIEKFHEFSEKLIMSDESAEKVKNTFKGLFSVIKVAWNVIKKLAGAIVKLLGNFSGLGSGILGVTSTIGDWLSGISKSIEESTLFGDIIDKVVGFIQSLIDNIKALTGGLTGNGFSGFIKIFKSIGTVVASVGKAIGSLFTGGSLETVFKTLNTGIVGGILYKLYKFIDGFKDSFDDFGENIVGILGGVKDCLSSFQESIKAKALKEIAVAVLILAGALVILSLIDPNKLSNALVAMAGAFAELLGSFAIFNKIGGFNGKNAAKSIGIMIGLSFAILILASAMKKLSGLSWEGIAKGLAGVGGLMLELMGFLKFANFDKKMKRTATGILLLSLAMAILSKAVQNFAGLSWEQIGKGLASIGGLLLEIGLFSKLTNNAKGMLSMGASMILLGASMKIFASAMKDMASMSWEEIGKGLVGIAGALVSVALAMRLMPKNMVSRSIGLIGVGAALLIIGEAMEPISKMSWEEIGKGLAGIAGALLAIGITMRVMPKNMILQSVGLIGISTALLILNKSLSSMGNMSWEQIGKGLATLAGSLVILAVGLKLMKGTISGSFALLVAAGALAVIAPVLKVLGSMNLKSIGIAMLALAGVFTIFGIAALALSPVIPAMFGISAALLVFGAACGLVGFGISAAAVGISALGGSLVAVGASIVDIIVDIVKGLGEIIVAACQSIIESAPAIAEALVVLIESACVALRESLPIIAETLVDLFDTLVEYAPQLVESLFNLLIVVFDKLAEKAPELVSSLVKVFGSIFGALKDELGKEGFSNLGKAVSKLPLMLLELAGASFILSKISIVGVMKAIANLAILVGGIGLIISAIGLINKIPGVEKVIDDGSRILGKIGTAIGEFFGNIAGGLISGVTSTFPKVAENLSNFMTDIQPFIDGAKKIDSSIFDGVKTLTSVISELTKASFMNALGSFVSFGNSSLGMFAVQIVMLGEGLAEFSKSVSGGNFDAESVKSASKAAEGLAAINNALSQSTASNSFWGWLSGATDIGNFGPKLKTFGEGLADFSQAITNGNFDAESVKSAADAATGLVELNNSLSGSTASDSFWGWLSGAMDIGNFGPKLKTFGEGLAEFSSSVSGNEFDAEKVISAANSAEALVNLNNKLSGSTASDSFWGWLSGANDIGNFGTKLSTFGSGLVAFSASVSGEDFDSEKVIAAAKSAEAIVELNSKLSSSTASDSFWGWLSGATDIGNFGSKLSIFGEGLAAFSVSVSGQDFDPEKVKVAASAAEGLVKLNESLSGSTASDSFWGWLSGAQDIGNFGTKLSTFGEGLAAFSAAVSGESFDSEKVKSAAESASCFVALNESLSGSTASDSFWGWLSGAMDIGSFGTKLSIFGEGLSSFASSVSGKEFDPEKVTAAAKSAEGIAELNKSLSGTTASDSFWGWLSGASDLGNFSSKLSTFGDGLAAFSEAVSEKEFDPEKVKSAAAAAGGIAELNKSLSGTTASDSFWGWLSGASDIGNFGDKLGNFGEGLGEFSEAVSGKNFNPEKVNAAAAVSKGLAALVTALPDKDSMGKLGTFGDKISKFGEKLSDFSSDVSDMDTDSCGTAISNALALSGLITELASTDYSGVKDFNEALKTLGETSIDDFVKAFSDTDKLSTAGKNMIDKLINGIVSASALLTTTLNSIVVKACDILNKMTSPFARSGSLMMTELCKGISKGSSGIFKAISVAVKSAISEITSLYHKFKVAGYNLGMGFANGISSSNFAVKLKAKALAQAALDAAKKTLDERSPSKETFKIGAFFGEGFVNGIGSFDSESVAAGNSIAESAKYGLTSAISKIKSAVEDGVDTQPTIRPVLDLTDIKNGAGAINGMFDMSPSVRTLYSVGTINRMMNSSQNGSNSDVISAIENLGRKMSSTGGDVYNLNGITYDDGSNVSDAVKTIIKAARVERRK